MENKPKSIEATRAKVAFDFAEKGMEVKNEKFVYDNYAAAVRELPALIRMNGLRAAMAYYFQKEKEGNKLVFKQIRKWFAKEDPTACLKSKFPQNEKTDDFAKNFMDIFLKLDNDEYRIAQAETLALANWMIRFVKTQDDSKKEVENGTE